MSKSITTKVSEYYTQKITEHGASSRGVDWNGPESQFLRFKQLCRILPDNESCTLLDFGCGYGALLDYLKETKYDVQYSGLDISEKMIAEARKLYPNNIFESDPGKLQLPCDYSIASGIFNVRLDVAVNEWEHFIENTLNELNQYSTKGFAFNMLTSYSDPEYMKDYLHYADPCRYFDFCKKHYSRHVALLHDYGLYEFTILVRK